MNLILYRKYLKEDYTIGKLYINNGYGNLTYICDTLEDKVRDTNKDGDLNDIGETKVYGKTAIPYGKYVIDMNTISPKFSNFTKYPKYKKYDGKLPRLFNVKHFTGVLIHIGCSSNDTDGCVLVGENKQKAKLVNSTSKFYALMDNYLLPAKERGEEITLEIV